MKAIFTFCILVSAFLLSGFGVQVQAQCPIPSGLSASATHNSATLTWTANSAQSFRIEYRQNTSPTWLTANSNTNTYTLTGLQPSTVYLFRVKSVCVSGTGAETFSMFSAPSDFHTLANAPPCFTPQNVASSAITSSAATITWSSTGAPLYRLEYKLSTATTWTGVNTSATTYTLSGLQPSSPYVYRVQSICFTGTGPETFSPFSANADFHTLAGSNPCQTPYDLHVLSVTSTSISIAWLANGATSYAVSYRKVGAPAWTNLTSSTNSITISGLLISTQYEFRVKSRCLSGTGIETFSDFTQPITETTSGSVNPCPIPGGVHITNVTATSISLAWAPAPASGYVVVYRQVGTTMWINTNTPINSIVISGLQPGITYEFKVKSKCSTGTGGETFSDFSPTIQETTSGNPLPCHTPSGVVVTQVTPSTISVSWNPAGANFYQISYRASGTTVWTNMGTPLPNITITGLIPITTYEIKVRSKCLTGTGAEVFSDFSAPVTGTTTGGLELCIAPVELSAHQITATSAFLSWSNTGANAYRVMYRKANQTNWTTVTTTTNSLLLSGLSPSSGYVFKVIGVCIHGSGNEELSPASSPSEFHTPQHIELFPNPCHDWIHFLHYSLTNETIHVTISNSAGVVFVNTTMNLSQGVNPIDINVMSLPPGHYTIQVVVGTSVYTRHFTIVH